MRWQGSGFGRRGDEMRERVRFVCWAVLLRLDWMCVVLEDCSERVKERIDFKEIG